MAFNDRNRLRKTYSFFRARPVPITISVTTAEEINMLTYAQYLTGTYNATTNEEEIPLQADVNGNLKVNIVSGSTLNVSGTFGNRDTFGNLVVVGPAVSGSTAKFAPVLVGGADSSNVVRVPLVDSNRAMSVSGSFGTTDTSGRQLVVGAIATGGTSAGNPVLIAGSSGVNTVTVPLIDTNRALLTTGSVGIENVTRGIVQPQTVMSSTLNTVPLGQFASGTVLLSSGQMAPLQLDRNAFLMIREQYASLAEDNANGVFATHPRPLNNATYSPSQFFSPQFTTGSIKASAGNVYGFVANNNTSFGYYFAIINKATAGASGDIPVLVKFLPASSSQSEQFPFGFNCATGIAMAFSTQPNVVALPSSSTGLSANVFYL